MGAALRKATRVPVQLDSWESLVEEAQRLEESLRGLVREVREGRDLFLKSRLGSIKSQVLRIRGPLTVCARNSPSTGGRVTIDSTPMDLNLRGVPEKLEWIRRWTENLNDLQLMLSAYAETTLTPICELEEKLLE